MTLGVLLAHGSPDPRSSACVRAAASAVAARTGLDVVAAFLDHDEPSRGGAVGGHDGDVVVLPLLLSSGFHARVDVPEAGAALALGELGHVTGQVVLVR